MIKITKKSSNRLIKNSNNPKKLGVRTQATKEQPGKK